MAELDQLRQATISLANSVQLSVDTCKEVIEGQKNAHPTKRLHFKPEPFTGENPSSIVNFVRDFERFSAYNKLDDGQIAEAFPLFLTKTAATFYDALPPETKRSYENSIKSLRDHFLPKSSVILRRSVFHAVKLSDYPLSLIHISEPTRPY